MLWLFCFWKERKQMSETKTDRKDRKISRAVPVLILAAAVLAVIAGVFLTSGIRQREKAAELLEAARQEQQQVAEHVEHPDRDTYLTVDGKVVVGFVKIPSLSIEYAILNTFDEHTAACSPGMDGTTMPWDAEGMMIYGIQSFTGNLKKLEAGAELVFEDLAGAEYAYQYVTETKEKVIDHGIRIICAGKDKKERAAYQFVQVK